MYPEFEDEAIERGEEPAEEIGLTPPKNVSAIVDTSGLRVSGTFITKVMSPGFLVSIESRVLLD